MSENFSIFNTLFESPLYRMATLQWSLSSNREVLECAKFAALLLSFLINDDCLRSDERPFYFMDKHTPHVSIQYGFVYWKGGIFVGEMLEVRRLKELSDYLQQISSLLIRS